MKLVWKCQRQSPLMSGHWHYSLADAQECCTPVLVRHCEVCGWVDPQGIENQDREKCYACTLRELNRKLNEKEKNNGK
jgi:hypothetical protein